jgi:vacuolar-type H+-ATPase subunit E/Vma4
MKTYGSPAAVIAAIRDEADAEVARIDQEARAAAERIRQHDAADPVAIPDRDARMAAARREAAERLARAEWRDTRAALEARERWMAGVELRGRARLATETSAATEAGRRVLAALAVEAIRTLRAAACEIVLDPRDVASLDEAWRAEVARAAQCADLRIVGGNVTGGCLVRTLDGRATFENTVESRARRFEAQWRTALGRIYGEAACASPSPVA